MLSRVLTCPFYFPFFSLSYFAHVPSYSICLSINTIVFFLSIYLYIVIHFDYVLLIYNSHQHCSKLSTEEYNGLVYFGSQQDTIITKEYLSPVLDNRTRMILHYRQPPLSPLEEFVLENYIDFIPNYKMVQIGEDGYEPNQ